MAERGVDEHRLSQALAGRRVLLTGHSGFKGGWLALWLRRLGADITAVSLPPVDGGPSMFEAVGIADLVDHRIADIGDERAYAAAVKDVDADLVIHMAAQALVRPSYAAPVETFRTNVLGTAIVLDAARRMPSLAGILVVTSDKCYENEEWAWGYRESDPMGGADPYSASKGCAELVAAAYRRSYFGEPGSPILATARAGNVIGGGDWSVDRLVPDIVRGFASGTPVHIRNPGSIRPWQHVLEPLSGYLQLCAAMIEGRRDVGGAWNFGPDVDGVGDVGTLARSMQRIWGAGPGGSGAAALVTGDAGPAPHEADILRLDSTKARTALGWRPRLTIDEAVSLTVEWYRACVSGSVDMRALSVRQIERYVGVDRDAASLHPSTFPTHSNGATACA